jgi:hypothetical protein
MSLAFRLLLCAGCWMLGWCIVGCSGAANGPASVLPAQLPTGEVRWPEPAPLPAQERIEADVELFGIKAGVFRMTLTRSCSDQRPDPVALRSAMSTVGIVRFFKATDGTSYTTMDAATARPHQSDLVVRDGDITRVYKAALAAGTARIRLQRTGQQPKTKTARIPTGEHPLDMQSAFVLLRHWTAERGTKGYFYVILGKELWRVAVEFKGVRRLTRAGRTESAVHVGGIARRVQTSPDGNRKTRRFTMWLSNDEARIPLRVEGDASFGTLHFELTSHTHEPASARSCLTTSR